MNEASLKNAIITIAISTGLKAISEKYNLPTEEVQKVFFEKFSGTLDSVISKNQTE